MKGALCVYHLLTAMHTRTVAKLQKADNSRLNLSSETLVFLQSVFWHIGLPVSTNKLFWNSETRCPQGHSLSQNLQKNFSSCVSKKVAFSVQCKSYVERSQKEMSKHQLKCKIRYCSTEPPLPTAAADLHWHLLQRPLTCLTWLSPLLHPLSESMSAPGQCPGPLINRMKRGEIGKAKQWQADDSEHTVSKTHRQWAHHTYTDQEARDMKKDKGRVQI